MRTYWLTGILGIITIIAPYLFGYSFDLAALWTSLIIGAILLITSIFEGMAAGREKWEYWIVGITGIAAVLAPFVFGFSTLTAAFWTLVIIGVITVIAAGAKLFPGQTEYR